jgi:hypothetical protein
VEGDAFLGALDDRGGRAGDGRLTLGGSVGGEGVLGMVDESG